MHAKWASFLLHKGPNYEPWKLEYCRKGENWEFISIFGYKNLDKIIFALYMFEFKLHILTKMFMIFEI